MVIELIGVMSKLAKVGLFERIEVVEEIVLVVVSDKAERIGKVVAERIEMADVMNVNGEVVCYILLQTKPAALSVSPQPTDKESISLGVAQLTVQKEMLHPEPRWNYVIF